MSETHYDLIVIGSGSGLNVASAAVNQLGWRVAIIEKGPVGGTCLNRGCIPSKMVIHAADVAEEISRSEIFGISSEITGIDFAKITNRANEMVDADSHQIEENLRKHSKIDLYKGEGAFSAQKKVIVNDQEISGDRVLIAAGARPFVPPIEGIDKVNYWTSTEALRQTVQPRSMVVIGGGYIGMELGHFYGALGTEITVIEALPTLISREDKDISETFTKLFSDKYTVHLNSKVMRVSQDQAGEKTVAFQTQDGQEQLIETDAILLVTGTKPNADTLHLENTQVQTSERGYITFNEHMETNEENACALGDIVGIAPFKHGANYEAQIVFNNMTTENKLTADYTIMPHAIFTSPQIAGVGLTQQEAEEKGLSYEVRRHDYIKTGMGKAIEAENGFVKFIINPQEQTILGCHILGPEASTLIHEVIVAMKHGGSKISAIKDTIHIHPALNEVVQRAL